MCRGFAIVNVENFDVLLFSRSLCAIFAYNNLYIYEEKFACVVVSFAAGGGIGILFLAEPWRFGATIVGNVRCCRIAGDGR